MNHEAISHLEKILEQQRSFDIGPTLSKGWNIWRSNAGAFIGFGIVVVLISMALVFIPFIGQLANMIVSPALTLGGAIYAYRCHVGEQREFSNFFDGFSHWKQIVIYAAILFVGMTIFFIPLFAIIGLESGILNMFTDPDNFTMAAPNMSTMSKVLLTIIVFTMIYLSICITLTVYFIGFYELSAMDALKYSFRFVRPKWWAVFAFMIVTAFIGMSGVILLVIGAFLTMSIIYPMFYAAFDELTAIEEYYAEESLSQDDDITDMFR